jgi:hypothetical protein
LQATVDFYKRSVKTEGQLNFEKEVIIKNYRLQVVDASKDITDLDRRLMHLNQGTSIYVSNSLLRPEKHKYSTEVNSTELGNIMLHEHFVQVEATLLEQESRRDLLQTAVLPITPI